MTDAHKGQAHQHGAQTTVAAQVTSDFICPWCFIAERRLRKVAQGLGVKVELEFLPYELNPGMPAEGMDRAQYRSSKFGSLAKSQELDRGTVEASKDDPLELNYDRMRVTPNTRRAHRLVKFAGKARSGQVADAIFEAYFTRGEDIGSVDVLVDVAASVGMERSEVAEYLRSDRGDDEVRRAVQAAQSSGVGGVPWIRFPGELELRGAQDAATMRAVLQRASAQARESKQG